MRDIKIRAWNMITNKMIDLKKCTPLALNMDTDGLFIPFSGMPLMQFTGLKDSERKEIYEGDVLEIDGGADPYRTSVFFKDGCFCVDMDNHAVELKWYINMRFCKVKVIGNIHENSGLLK